MASAVDFAPAPAIAVPLNTEDDVFKDRIQNHLQTHILSALEFLGFMKVHLLSVSSAAGAAAAAAAAAVASADDSAAGAIRSIKFISSWGNHATAVCLVTEDVKLENRVTACLQFKSLPRDVGVVTNRYDSPQGVVQIVFPKLVEKVREIMVLGNVPLDQGNWANWERTITDSVFDVLNEHGITAGRNELERKLAASFKRIRELSLPESEPLHKQIELREIRVKYCDLLMDLLRDDLLQKYDGNVQKGLLGTINFGNNTNDKYDIHNGKPVTDPTLRQAAYNVLFLVHIDIGGHIYTVHMDIDRVKVEKTYGSGRYQSVSYWVGGMIEYIHKNKGAFLKRVYDALSDCSVIASGVDPVSAGHIKTFILGKLHKIGAGASDVMLVHDAFILSCKSVTLIQETAIVTPEPNNDNAIGIEPHGNPYILFKEGTKFNRKYITGANFNVYYDNQSDIHDITYDVDRGICCHFPSYDSRSIDQILQLNEGTEIATQESQDHDHVTTEESLDLMNELTKDDRKRGVSPSEVVGSAFDELSKFRATQVEGASPQPVLKFKKMKLPAEDQAGDQAGEQAGEEEEEEEEEEAEKIATNLADALNTSVNATTPPETEAAKLTLLRILANPKFVAKKVVGVICGSFNFWLKRTSSSSPLLHDKVFGTELLDLILLVFENRHNKIKLITDLTDLINNKIRERSLELSPPDPRILYYPAAVAASAGGGGGRSRSRSVKKKTRRPCRKYYSIKNMKKKRVCQSKRKMISRRRSHKRKN